jgi:pyruvate dehydrogenase E2 component (dihydrolipoamide acetyltransferase)
MSSMSASSRVPAVHDLRLDGGRRLRVRRWDGDGRPLVLLHGLFDDSEGWVQVATDTDRPCLAFDLPGFGGSHLPTRPRISAYAEAVCAGLEQLALDDCALVGHSLGGAVAVAVAEKAPATVQSLALLAPAGFGPIGIADLFALPGVRQLAELSLPLAMVNPLTVTAAYATFVAHHRLPSRDLMDRVRRRAFRSGPGVSSAVQAIAAAGRSPRGFHRRGIGFHGPVAALWGEHDALVPRAHAAALARALPQAHVEVWAGMGHHPQRERPTQLARFIEEHAVQGTERSDAAAPDAGAGQGRAEPGHPSKAA